MNPLPLPARRPRLVLLVALLATAASVALALRLRPETALAGLLDPNDPAVAAMGRVLGRFPVVEELLVLVTLPAEAADDPGPLRAFAESLEKKIEGDADARAMVASYRYREGPAFRAFVSRVVVPEGVYYLDDAGFAAARGRLTAAGMRRQLTLTADALATPGPAAGAVAKGLAKDPLRLNELLGDRLRGAAPPGSGSAFGPALRGGALEGLTLSPDGRSLLIRIEGSGPPGDLTFSRRLTEAVGRLSLLAKPQAAGAVEVEFAGAYAVAAYDTAAITSDSIWGTTSSVVGLAVLFGVLFRRPVRLFLLAFAPVAVGIAWGFGLYAVWSDTITPLAAVVGGALGGIGIDYSIHYLSHFGGGAGGGAAAVGETSRALRRPMLAAWLTSVIGFVAVAFSPVRMLRDFAVLGSLSLLGVWAATTLALPAALVWLGGGGEAGATATRLPAGKVLAGWVARRPGRVLIVSGAMLAAVAVYLLAAGGRVSVESDLTVLHPQPNPPLAAQRHVGERMGLSPGSMILHLSAGSPDKLLDLAWAVRKRLESKELRAAGLSSTFGLASLLPDPSTAGRAAELPDAAATVASFRAQAADVGFAPGAFSGYETFLSRLLTPGPPPGVSALADYPQVGRLVLPRSAGGAAPTEAITLCFFDSPLADRAGREAAVSALRDATADLPGVVVTGMPAITRDVERHVRRDMPWQIGVALLCVVGYLVGHFRSVKLAALAVLPTAISLACLLAFMEATGTKLNLVNGVMVPLLLGINVDYGIFAASARREGTGQESTAASATALLACAATTVVGFGSMALTSVPAVRSLGVLVAIGVAGCLAGTLFVLLPLLRVASAREHRTAA